MHSSDPSNADNTEKTAASHEDSRNFERIFRHNPAMMTLSSLPERIFSDANAAFLRTLGYSSDQVIGKPTTALGLFPSPEQHEAVASTILKERRIQDTEIQIRRSDGKILDCLFSGQTLEFHHKTYFLAVFVDMTERKQTEKKLRFLSTIITGMSDAILATDTDYRITYINRAASELYGYTMQELLGGSPDILNADPQAGIIRQRIHETLSSGGTYLGEFLSRRKDGSLFLCEYKIMPVINEEGHVFGYAGIQRDISECRETEKKLSESSQKLEEANRILEKALAQAQTAHRAKSTFLANMSHELRTPMNGVIGMTELLLETRLTERQRHYLNTIRTNGQSLLGLISDILDFSKIEAEGLDLDMQDFNLADLMKEIQDAMAPSAHKKGLAFFSDIAPEVPLLLRGDSGRLRQILTHLTDNAIKFTHDGDIRTHASLVAKEPDRALLRFSIQDTGIGIPDEKQDIIFEKFTYVEADAARRYGGAGLGLAISRQLAELMGGEIGVESRSGKGSTFWFTVSLGFTEAPSLISGPPPRNLNNLSILIVDGDTSRRNLLAAQAKESGMRPSEAESAQTALEALYLRLRDTDIPSFVLMDMELPDMDGEALGRIIRADIRMKEIRLVLLLPQMDGKDPRHFTTIGFNGCLVRPVTLQDMQTIFQSPMTSEGPSAIRIAPRSSPAFPVFDSHLSLLLVEDNPTNRQIALSMLSRLGLHADTVENGAQALASLQATAYDLVLMDVQMPIMDGLSATREIRRPESGAKNPQIPIIAMTACSMKDDREKCLLAGMNDYIAKPVSPQDLAGILQKWLPGRRNPPGPFPSPGPAEKAPAHPCVWNPETLENLLSGDREMIASILATFIAQIPVHIRKIRESLEQENLPLTEREAHTLKGASSQVGAETLKQAAGTMEETARAGNMEKTLSALPELEKQAARFLSRHA